MRLFMGQIEQLQKTVYDLQETLSQKTIEAPLVQNKAQQGFVRPNGTIVVLDKHKKRKFKDQKDRDQTFLDLKNKLVAAGLHPGSVNMGLLGIGRGSYLDWTNRVFRPTKSPASKPMKDDDEPQEPAVIQDRALASAAPTTIDLPVGTRVIANPNPKQAAGTKKQQLKRALEAYGEDSVIENAEDCEDGTSRKSSRPTKAPNVSCSSVSRTVRNKQMILIKTKDELSRCISVGCKGSTVVHHERRREKVLGHSTASLVNRAISAPFIALD